MERTNEELKQYISSMTELLDDFVDGNPPTDEEIEKIKKFLEEDYKTLFLEKYQDKSLVDEMQALFMNVFKAYSCASYKSLNKNYMAVYEMFCTCDDFINANRKIVESWIDDSTQDKDLEFLTSTMARFFPIGFNSIIAEDDITKHCSLQNENMYHNKVYNSFVENAIEYVMHYYDLLTPDTIEEINNIEVIKRFVNLARERQEDNPLMNSNLYCLFALTKGKSRIGLSREELFPDAMPTDEEYGKAKKECLDYIKKHKVIANEGDFFKLANNLKTLLFYDSLDNKTILDYLMKNIIGDKGFLKGNKDKYKDFIWCILACFSDSKTPILSKDEVITLPKDEIYLQTSSARGTANNSAKLVTLKKLPIDFGKPSYLDTIFHELTHIKDYELLWGKREPINVQELMVLLEFICERKIKGWEKNYWDMFFEIGARIESHERTAKYIDDLHLKQRNSSRSLRRAIKGYFKEATVSFEYDKKRYNGPYNRCKDFQNKSNTTIIEGMGSLIEKSPKLLEKYHVLKLLFNENGRLKPFDQALEGLGQMFDANNKDRNIFVGLMVTAYLNKPTDAIELLPEYVDKIMDYCERTHDKADRKTRIIHKKFLYEFVRAGLLVTESNLRTLPFDYLRKTPAMVQQLKSKFGTHRPSSLTAILYRTGANKEKRSIAEIIYELEKVCDVRLNKMDLDLLQNSQKMAKVISDYKSRTSKTTRRSPDPVYGSLWYEAKASRDMRFLARSMRGDKDSPLESAFKRCFLIGLKYSMEVGRHSKYTTALRNQKTLSVENMKELLTPFGELFRKLFSLDEKNVQSALKELDAKKEVLRTGQELVHDIYHVVPNPQFLEAEYELNVGTELGKVIDEMKMIATKERDPEEVKRFVGERIQRIEAAEAHIMERYGEFMDFQKNEIE